MTDSSKDGPVGPRLVPVGSVEHGYVVLPYSKDEFKDFIGSLLGTPQAITRTLVGSFDICPDDIRNLQQLISQRILQQNEASLARFSARIGFDDGSTVELNSLEELITYNEIRPLVTSFLHVRWDWLVRFQDKRVPERQGIEATFVASDGTTHGRFSISNDPDTWSPGSAGSIAYRIEHTARTWGSDIEALLSAHFTGIVTSGSGLRALLNRNSSTVGVAGGGVFAIGSLVGAYTALSAFASAHASEVARLMGGPVANDVPALDQKLRRLFEYWSSGADHKFGFGLSLFLMVSLLGGLSVGTWIGSLLDSRAPSFIVFSKHDQLHKVDVLHRLDRQWQTVLLALGTSVFAGVLGNWIFRWVFG